MEKPRYISPSHLRFPNMLRAGRDSASQLVEFSQDSLPPFFLPFFLSLAAPSPHRKLRVSPTSSVPQRPQQGGVLESQLGHIGRVCSLSRGPGRQALEVETQGGNTGLAQFPVQITPGVVIFPVGGYLYFMSRRCSRCLATGGNGCVRSHPYASRPPTSLLIPCSTPLARVPILVFKF